MKQYQLSKKTKKSRMNLFDTMAVVASLFAGMKVAESNQVINHTLKLIGDFVKADRAYIFKYDFDANICTNTYEHCAEGITPEIDNLQNISLDLVPEWVVTHRALRPMIVSDVSKLNKNDSLRHILEPQGIQSLLTIPMIRDQQLYGFLGFDSVKRKHKYSSYEQHILTEYANLLHNAVERVELEKKLQQEQLRAEMLADSARVGAWEWNLETDEVKFNHIWGELIGLDASELIHHLDTWKKYTHPDDLKKAIQLIDDYLAHKTPFYQAEFRMIHKDGHYVWVRDTGKIIEWKDGKPLIMLGAHIEIDEIKQVEQQLKVIDQAIKYSPDSIVITDEKNRIVYVNPKFEEMTGYTFLEVMGKNPRILKSGYHDDAYYRKIYEIVNRGEVWHGEFYNRRKNGTFYWEQASISAVFDEDHKITNYTAIKIDISERKKMEEALAKRRKELEDEVAAKMMEIEDSQQAAIIALAQLTEARDHDTGRHVERVQYLCKALTSKLREHPKYSNIIDNKYVSDMFFASALHDIGKIDIPDQVLLKPGKLTKDEFEVIKSHVKLGEKILADMVKFYPKSNLILLGRQIAKYHHEKWDGSGYLGELKGEEIPLSARIMALVDVYDALRSKRPYKDPMTHQEAYAIIIEGSGKHFDPEIVEAFVQINEQFDAIFNSLNE